MGKRVSVSLKLMWLMLTKYLIVRRIRNSQSMRKLKRRLRSIYTYRDGYLEPNSKFLHLAEFSSVERAFGVARSNTAILEGVVSRKTSRSKYYKALS